MRALCYAPAISGLTNDYVMVAHIGVRAAFLRADEMLCKDRSDAVDAFGSNAPGDGPLGHARAY